MRRQLNAEVGAGAIAVARIPLETTDIQAAEIAFAAGLCAAVQRHRPADLRPPPAVRGGRGPYAASEVFDYLGNRAIDGIERLTGERGARIYRRTLRRGQ
ncbi:hypothetical protein [Streptomyces himastatinicus]|uniref:hypothetical protein n=1 Tax=Streptomyces himastatinicus TaxID=998084 RepID=UPI001AD7F0CC|nr:hypothetical protein [Streptomyces himastatinicus]